jgi:general secretion pathway protein C
MPVFKGHKMQVAVRRAAVFLVWALVGLSLAFWASRWMGRAQAGVGLPAVTSGDGVVTPPDGESLATALRGPLATPAAASAPLPTAGPNLALLGIVKSARASESLALISVDNQPARTFRAGATLAPGWVVQAVRVKEVLLGPERSGPAARTLEMPKAADASKMIAPNVQQPPAMLPKDQKTGKKDDV